MWKDKLQEIIQEKKIYGEKINIGAQKMRLKYFLRKLKLNLM